MKKIAIIWGGDSSEYEVSRKSGMGIYSFFDKEKYECYLVCLKKGEWYVETEGGKADIDKNDFSFTEKGEKKTFDYAYITIHGTPGENGFLQGYFELIGMPYSTCSVLVEALTFDKFVLNNYLRQFGVSVADSILVRKGEEKNLTEEGVTEAVGFPCFVKPAADGSSFGVSKVNSWADMQPALDKAFAQSDMVMIETMLEGMEIAQGVYKTKEKSIVFPATEVVSQNDFFDFDAKYNGQVTEITPARLPQEVSERVAKITSAVYDILHANGIIRVDYIIKNPQSPDAKISMLEINTTPGMTPTSFIPQQVKAAGLNMGDVLADIVENNIEH